MTTSDTRDCEFDAWLHGRGYQYVGDTSMYRLTIPEMARLYNGWRSIEEKEAEAEAEAYGQGAAYRARASNPHHSRGGAGRVRESDLRTAREFAEKHGLRNDT